MLTYEEITKSEAIKTYIIRADESLGALGYTEHSFAHVMRVSDIAGNILQELGYSAGEIELARIAGYMHDIGNMVNREEHSQSGSVMAFYLLNEMGISCEVVINEDHAWNEVYLDGNWYVVEFQCSAQ